MNRSLFRITALLSLWFISTLVLDSPARAETAWSPPTIVFEQKGTVTNPVVVADSEGDVHLIFVYRQEQSASGDAPGALMYARRHAGVWSKPVDVLVAPDGGFVDVPIIALDKQGYLHVTWLGGVSNQVYYSRAHVSQAGTARGWLAPKSLSDRQGIRSDIFASSDGLLHFVYAGRGGNVFYRQSTDRGQTWSGQSAVSNVDGTKSASDYPRIVADERGTLHAVWTQFKLPEAWPPTGAYYSRSQDGGKTWSTAIQVAGENYGMINVSAGLSDTVNLAWNAIVSIGDRMYEWSTNGGQTWTPAQRITQKIRGGFTGYPSMAVDSAGTLHLITSVNGQGGKTEDVYHLTWNGKTWSEPVLLSNGTTGKRSVELPWLAIGEGNHLHVVYEDDFQRIWYTSRVVDAPATPRQALPTPILTPQPTLKAVATLPTVNPSLAPTAEPTMLSVPQDQVTATTPMNPLLIGTLPALLVIGAIILLHVVRTR